MTGIHRVVLWTLLWMAVLALAAPAHARVELPQKFIASMGFGNCSPFVDGCRFASNLSGDPENAQKVRQSYYETIKDGHLIGIEAFVFDATSNSAGMEWRVARFNEAMRQYNAENPTTKKCLAVMYEKEESPLGLFEAADTGGGASPYCTLDGKPVVGVWGNGTFVNPLPGLTGKGPFVILGTIWNTPDNMPTKANVDAWKASGASRVLSYWWVSGNFNGVGSAPAAKKTFAESTGAEFVMGLGSTRGTNCGAADVCEGGKSANYVLHDNYGWISTTQAFTRAKELNVPAMYTMSHPGDYGEGSYWELSLIHI